MLCFTIDSVDRRPKQVVGRLNSLLGQFERFQDGNRRVFDRAEYKVVKRRNHKDHIRYLNLLNLSGPSQDTLDLLDEHADSWRKDPLSFWTRPEAVNMQFSGPRSPLSSQAQLVGHYLQAKADGA